MDKYKRWYLVVLRNKNRVEFLIDRDLMEQVVKVWRINDRMMEIKFLIRGSTLNIVSSYTPQEGLGKEEKKLF